MKGNFYVIGIGASAGGQHALTEFFSSLPTDINAAFFVITHLPRNHVSQLSRIISRFTKIPTTRMKGREMIRPQHIYVLPEDALATIENDQLVLRRRPQENIVNYAIDEFFVSLAHAYGEKAIGIIFSGMGSDGAKGSAVIHEHGGKVLVQEPHSATFQSMPWAAIQADHPTGIFKPTELGKHLHEYLTEKTRSKVLNT
jgi:two-component system CheB/CheR fusion protein